MTTDDQYREHLLAGTDKCMVCDTSPLVVSWTDYNGQGRCLVCGTTHQVLGSHHTDEFLKRLGITKDMVARKYCDCFDIVPILRLYWNETHRQIPMGSYFVARPPWSREDSEAFIQWLHDNEPKLAAEYPDTFDWQGLREWKPEPQAV